jgi:aminoglycoside phosphotransferase (APT) family kinase protein
MTPSEFQRLEQDWESDVITAQSRWHAPRHVVEAIVSRVTGESPARVDRIHAGQSNETYVCDAASLRLIVRIGRGGAAHFERERWAIRAARAQGVPTPDVLLVGEEHLHQKPVSFCVERFIPGLSLGKLARRRGRADAVLATALRNAGHVLAAIHEVRTSGFGELRPDGSGALSDWPAFLAERLGPVPNDAPIEVGRALAAIEQHRPLLVATAPRLLHFDFEPSHLLTDENTGKIVGVIDFEEAKSGDPAYDLAQWDVIHDAYAPVSELAHGYGEVTTASSEFELRRLLSEVHFRARQIAQSLLPPDLVPAARERLALAIDEIS